MQQQPQQQQPQYQAIGHIATLDNKRQFKPLRVSFVEASGQVRWFSAFEGVGKSLEAGGEGSGPWTLTYSEKPYVSATGSQGVNLNIRQAVLNGQAAQPQAQPQYQAQAPAQQMPVAEFIPNAGTAPAWSLNMDDRGRSIIRQVAFKEIGEKNSQNGDQLNALTDLYESIILGTYQPTVDAEEAPPPADEEFIQETF